MGAKRTRNLKLSQIQCGGFEAGGFDGFAILTREADGQMRPYHDRMPVILDSQALRKLWLFAPPQTPYEDLRRQFELPRLHVRPASLLSPDEKSC